MVAKGWTRIGNEEYLQDSNGRWRKRDAGTNVPGAWSSPPPQQPVAQAPANINEIKQKTGSRLAQAFGNVIRFKAKGGANAVKGRAGSAANYVQGQAGSAKNYVTSAPGKVKKRALFHIGRVKERRDNFTNKYTGSYEDYNRLTKAEQEERKQIEAMRKAEDEQTKQYEAEERKVREAEEKDVADTKRGVSALEEKEIKDLKFKIEQAKQGIPGKAAFTLAIIIAVFFDIVSIAMGLVFPAELAIEAAALVILGFLLKGKFLNKKNVLWFIIEAVPGLNYIPAWTIAVFVSYNIAGKDAHKKIDEMEKELNILEGAEEGKKGHFMNFFIAALITFFVFLVLITQLPARQFVMLLVLLAVIFIEGLYIWNPWGIDIEKGRKTLFKLLLIAAIFGLIVFSSPMLLKKYGHMEGGFIGFLKKQSALDMVDIIPKITNFPKTLVTNAKQWFNAQMAYATGGYFEGEVEKNQFEQLGVYLEKPTQADPIFYEDEPVTMWANLKGRTLDKNITLSVGCLANKVPADKINPTGKATIDTLEEIEIDCTWNRLEPGAKMINVSASYSFETLAYLKSYFIDQTRARELRREQVDILDNYKITDKFPVALFTNGPVKIGMGTGDPPVEVPEEGSLSSSPTLGITLENRWEGRIQQVTRLRIMMPDSLGIIANGNELYCDHPVTGPIKDANYEGYNIYELNLADPGEKKRFSDVQTFVTVKCRYNVAGDTAEVRIENKKKLLGNTPISTQYFRAIAEYTYVTTQTTPIYVEKKFDAGAGGVGAVTDIPARVTPKVGCEGLSIAQCDQTNGCIRKARMMWWSGDTLRYDPKYLPFTIEYKTKLDDGMCHSCPVPSNFINPNYDVCNIYLDQYYCETADPCGYFCEWKGPVIGNVPLPTDSPPKYCTMQEYQWPITGDIFVVSVFGYRTDPDPGMHYGLDIKANVGTDIHAIASGSVVDFCGKDDNDEKANDDHNCGGFGRYITIRHSTGLYSKYGHLSSIDSRVVQGWEVPRGMVIGKTGNAGYSMAPHLHLQISKSYNAFNADSIDPFTVLPFMEGHIQVSCSASGYTKHIKIKGGREEIFLPCTEG